MEMGKDRNGGRRIAEQSIFHLTKTANLADMPSGSIPSGLFITPNLILHVYSRWKSGTADEETSRTFAIRDVRTAPHFVMLGGMAATSFIANWKPTDFVSLLRQLPSLREIEPEFWDYLSSLRVAGEVWAFPDGKIVDRPVTRSRGLVERDGGEEIPFPLVEITDRASVVALLSPALLSILDAQIPYGAMLLSHRKSSSPLTFWYSERSGHPILGRLAAEVETILGDSTMTKDGERLVYVMWEPSIPQPPTSSSSGWRLSYDPEVPFCPGGLATNHLSRVLDSDVKILFTGPVNVQLQAIGGNDE